MNRQKIFNRKINALISLIIINILIFLFILYCSNFLLIKLKFLAFNVYGTMSLQNFNENINVLKNINLNDIIKELKLYYKDIANSDIIKKGAIYTTDGIFSYFVGNISVYFILVDKYTILKFFGKFIAQDKLDYAVKKYASIKKMIKIEIMLVMGTTVQTVFGFLILGIDNAVFLGILCGIMDILPYVGTVLIFLPLVLYEIYFKHYILTAGLIFLYILLQVNRQYMETKFMSANLNIHPLLILLSLYIGGKIFGIIGLIIAPIYVLIAKEILINELGEI